MRTHHAIFRTSRLVLAAALCTAFGVALAADTAPSESVTTILKLKNAEGGVESLRFDGALAVGESRGYETDAGTPVLVTRTEEGLRLELPSHTVNLRLPTHDGEGHGVHAEIEKQVRISSEGGEGGEAQETRVVVLRGDGADAHAAEIEQLLEGDEVALDALAEGDGDGNREVVIVRKRKQEVAGD
jgi:hypothetical protein